jgi:hypothetical protein
VLHQIITRFRNSASKGIILTVYRRMPLGLIAGHQDHCHVGSRHRILRRYERRHIHRSRHRWISVTFLIDRRAPKVHGLRILACGSWLARDLAGRALPIFNPGELRPILFRNAAQPLRFVGVRLFADISAQRRLEICD